MEKNLYLKTISLVRMIFVLKTIDIDYPNDTSRCHHLLIRK